MIKFNKWIIIFVCTVILLLLIITGWKIYWENIAYSRMPPEQKKEFDEWRSVNLNLTLEELEAQPFSEETSEAVKAFASEWKDRQRNVSELTQLYYEYRDKSAREKSPEEFMKITEKLEQHEPLIRAFENLANQPDYEIEALVLCNDVFTSNYEYLNHDSEMTPVYPLMANQGLLEIKTDALLFEGKVLEASQAAETIIRSAKSHKYSMLMNRMIAMQGLNRGVKTWYRVVNHCDDPRMLREILDRQNLLVPPVLTEKDKNILVTHNLGIIRIAMRLGMDVDIENKTGRGIFRESLRLERRYLNERVFPYIKNKSQKERLGRVISYTGSRRKVLHKISDFLILDSWDLYGKPAMLYLFNAPNAKEVITRDMATRSRYDILRLETAQNLYAMEKGGTPGILSDLVPEYIPVLPKDLFSKEEKGLGEKPFIYSIGPDEIDQKGELGYDPTNGTISPGDIYFLPCFSRI
ncbi:hypothetical protein JW926_16585 [Candidatus Sumerlaeota bacterium]|nr:hypothetical protein [Candidatus Sumerlaeota bacterium]